MESVKELFKKLYDAHRWTEAHPVDDRYSAVVAAVEGWCDELEALGVNRTFSMCIYTFGADWEICYAMVKEENLTSNDKIW